MTKAEKATVVALGEAIDAARQETRLAKSLSWPVAPEPRRIATPYQNEVTSGWSSHWHPEFMGRGLRVVQGISDGVSHNPNGVDRVSTKGAGDFYANRLDALLVARHKATRWCAEQLAAIDREIELESGKVEL